MSCVDWALGTAVGGVGNYDLGFRGSQTARLFAASAVPPTAPVNLRAGQEYFALSLTINHAKTVGTNACGGCTIPVCIFLSRITLATRPGDVLLERGANFLGSQYVTWQNGYPINVRQLCDTRSDPCPAHYTMFDCVLATPTNSHGSTWGQVKSLYR